MRSRRFRQLFLASAFALLLCGEAAADSAPVNFGHRDGTAVDREAISHLLKSYTQSVAACDEKRFESLLLQPDITFSSTRGALKTSDPAAQINTRNYQSFKAAIFESGHRFHQKFYHVKIEQVGALAQVSLDFSTTDDSTGQTGYGWKVLQLLKVSGNWKIASEFFTGYPPVDAGTKG